MYPLRVPEVAFEATKTFKALRMSKREGNEKTREVINKGTRQET